MYLTYLSIFKNLGVKVVPLQADTGVIGGNLSHEFHVLAEAGESTLYYDKIFENITLEDFDSVQNIYAVTSDKYDKHTCPIKEEDLKEKKGIEVGQIFYLGTKYSEIMKAFINNPSGQLVPAEMGCYGIGVSRLVAAIIEANHDDAGIIWPNSITPFQVSIINLSINDEDATRVSSKLYNSLKHNNIKVLYDDTNERPGSKFATNDLIGVPIQIIVGKKAKSGLVEIKNRRTHESQALTVEEGIKYLLHKFPPRA